jgi:hypothetical protein
MFFDDIGAFLDADHELAIPMHAMIQSWYQRSFDVLNNKQFGLRLGMHTAGFVMPAQEPGLQPKKPVMLTNVGIRKINPRGTGLRPEPQRRSLASVLGEAPGRMKRQR